ncbi:MAG: redoxin domain-containing protein [Sedimentisphaerales bacterium]|nr:redoxin domain-containing protein [Sedimentisphaerales bacterium]
MNSHIGTGRMNLLKTELGGPIMKVKHILLMMAAMWMVLSVDTWAQRQGRQAAGDRPAVRAAQGDPARPRAAAGQAVRQQMEQLKAEHQALMGQLEEIRELARREKAEKTAQRVQKLMDHLGSAHEKRLQAMEQRIERMRQASDAVEESGAKAPDFTLKSFDGKTVTLSELKGKIVVLEWFNFECPFSLYHYQTRSTMADLANKYKDKNVVWLAINSTSHTKPEPNIEFAGKYKLPYPILDDRSGRVGRAYDAKTTPHMIVINPRGNIVYNGAIDNAPMGQAQGDAVVNYVDQALGELLAGKDITTKETKPYGCSVKYAN